MSGAGGAVPSENSPHLNTDISGDKEKRKKSGSRLQRFFDRIRPMGNGSSSTQQNSSGAGRSSNSPPSEKNMKICVSEGRMLDLEDVKRLIPELENNLKARDVQIAEKDAIIRKQESVISEQLGKIQKLQTDLQELQGECDKLRSVLAQKSPQEKKSKTSGEIMAQLQQDPGMLGQQILAKKQGVSAESDVYRTDNIKLVHHKKQPEAKQLLKDAVANNEFLKHLDHQQMLEMVDCMYEKSVPQNCWVIREGEAGVHLYVAQEGELEVLKGEKVLGHMGPGRVFGELALLYNCTRTASVKALTPAKLWVLDRAVYQMITMRMGLKRHEQLMEFLKHVPLLKGLPEERISKVADSLDEEYYAAGTHIVREGEKGATFYIISNGNVRVTQMVEGKEQPVEIRKLQAGDYFGEKALLGEDIRTASVLADTDTVEVLTLDRESFKNLIGDLSEFNKDYGDEARGAKIFVEKRRSTKEEIGYESHADVKSVPAGLREFDPLFKNLELTQLDPIATLGVGGFGRVDLVFIRGEKGKSYALKAMKKKHIVDTRQQEHIFSERNIMLELRSEFIVRLYRTFRDRKFVYMLLEVCLGGELWTILRDRGHFDELSARFYASCVVEALDYLHQRGIIYRDLKPENCLVDSHGYVKIVDFGFAKKLGAGRKTWTFCGTPEYVAPEIILNKGHDYAVDFWAFGIFICELLLGRPPFQASDPMKTYTLILKGVDALDIPNRRVGKTVTAMVKKLCRDNPAERIGCQSGGIDDIRKHRWFAGFDWDGLQKRTLKPPFIPKITGALDVGNFDQYPPDHDNPPDEFSGWDEGF